MMLLGEQPCVWGTPGGTEKGDVGCAAISLRCVDRSMDGYGGL